MAYFGRAPKKPQQLGRVVGGTTRPGLELPTAPRLRGLVRQAVGERPSRPGRAERAARTVRNSRAERSAR